MNRESQLAWSSSWTESIVVGCIATFLFPFAGAAAEIIVIPDRDFGDAPFVYGTLRIDDGAGHEIDEGLFLGELIDAEFDGLPSILADGDDLQEFDDEDGILFKTPLTVGRTVQIEATASQFALLNAWIDFDLNGSWNEPGDQIFIDTPLAPGTNSLVFSVPANAVLGDTYSRFRLSRSAGLRPGGLAPDGEVEDYRVSIVPEPSTALLVGVGLMSLGAARRRPSRSDWQRSGAGS